ncbi:hypothetical protein E1176_13880 [Fulvivirga sp. RKSG066]|nr:hypothetical protein [Fulvivirga aurantia]
MSLAAEGKALDDIKYFAFGTGMATEADGYKALYIRDKANHYLFYENENYTRVSLIDREDDFLKLQFNIDEIYIDGTPVSFEDSGVEKLYLVIHNDLNLDRIADRGELYKVIVTL